MGPSYQKGGPCFNGTIMSTAQEIWDVYSQEISDKSRLVYRKGGAGPFFNGENILRARSLFQVPDDDFIEDIVEEEYILEGRDAGSIRERVKEEGDQEVRVQPVP